MPKITASPTLLSKSS